MSAKLEIFSDGNIRKKKFDSRVNLHGVLLWGKVIGWQTSDLSLAPHAVQVSTFSSWGKTIWCQMFELEMVPMSKNDKYEVCRLAA